MNVHGINNDYRYRTGMISDRHIVFWL